MSEVDEVLECGHRTRGIPSEQLERLVDQKPRRSRRTTHGRAVATPLPGCSVLDEVCLHRIAEDVRDRADKVRHALELHSARPVPEQMIRPAMSTIRPPRVVSVELLETGRKLLLPRVKDQMVMIRHQAPCV